MNYAMLLSMVPAKKAVFGNDRPMSTALTHPLLQIIGMVLANL
jgi:hypothetical protein